MIFRFGKRGALAFPRSYARETALRIRNVPTVPVYWFTAIRNWGDLVGPYLVKHVTGAEPIPAYSSKRPHLLAVGSILSRSSEASLVWGAGFISKDERIDRVPSEISAVRGLYSRQRLEELGLEVPEVVGDPAVLMPRFYRPKNVSKSVYVGLIPHYADLPLLRGIELPAWVKLIDIRQDVEAFVDELCSCERVLSSSLHGLIAADAYGIPNLWIEFSANIHGNGFKFNDYYSSLDEPDTSPHLVSLNQRLDLSGLAQLASLHKPYSFSEQLLNAFPWGKEH